MKLAYKNQIPVAAHRGNSKYFPENTLIAFQSAIDMKADMVEIDLHMTADDVLILMHDHKVDRTTNGTGLIREKTFAEMKTTAEGLINEVKTAVDNKSAEAEDAVQEAAQEAADAAEEAQEACECAAEEAKDAAQEACECAAEEAKDEAQEACECAKEETQE